MQRDSTVTLRYWAAAREAAGRAEETFALDPDAPTLADTLRRAREAHGPRLGRVLDMCAFLIDEKPLGTRDPASIVLTDGARIEALPPFAGG